MTPGIYAGISNNDYHGGPGISKSGLDLINRSPAHLKAAMDAENDNEPTPAQAVGTAFHYIVLEPAEFVKRYCLALRPSDVPHAIEDRDTLVAMVAKLNEGRLPKLSTGGTKAEQIERISAAYLEHLDTGCDVIGYTPEGLEALKGAELKAHIEQINTQRAGLLPISGTRHELAEILRANGHEITLWSDVQAEWLQNNGHRTVLSQDQWTQLHAMRDAVFAHPAASFVLTKANNVVVDLKSCEDASEDGFSKSIANWRYDVQHPFYLDGLRLALEQSGQEPPVEGAAELSAYWHDPHTGVLCRCRPDYWRGRPANFVFIAVEKKAPYAVAVYVLDDDKDTADTPVKLGRAQYRANLNRYAQCIIDNDWPGYGEHVKTIRTPAWHANKNQHLLTVAG